MRCSSRPWRAWTIGAGRALARPAAVAFVLAASCPPRRRNRRRRLAHTHATDAQPDADVVNSTVSSGAALTNLGSNFLERLGNHRQRLQSPATDQSRRRRRLRERGNAALPDLVRRLRHFARNGALGVFVGDSRKTSGGVAGIGARVAPGINIGFSVDQSRNAIDIPLALQSATIDLTQFGFNASVDSGPWTWATAAVHGFGNINSRRDTGFGLATAGYNARLDGVLSEISYYWTRTSAASCPRARSNMSAPGPGRCRSSAASTP